MFPLPLFPSHPNINEATDIDATIPRIACIAVLPVNVFERIEYEAEGESARGTVPRKRKEGYWLRVVPSFAPWVARRCATSRASAAGTATSGLIPTPSQFVFVIGLMARPVGTKTVRSWGSGTPRPGLAPPPVVSPTIVARFRVCRLYANSSAAEKVLELVRTYTGL